jgi:hypothetical protein
MATRSLTVTCGLRQVRRSWLSGVSLLYPAGAVSDLALALAVLRAPHKTRLPGRSAQLF